MILKWISETNIIKKNSKKLFSSDVTMEQSLIPSLRD